MLAPSAGRLKACPELAKPRAPRLVRLPEHVRDKMKEGFGGGVGGGGPEARRGPSPEAVDGGGPGSGWDCGGPELADAGSGGQEEGAWMLGEGMEARLRSVFEGMDKDRDGTLTVEEREGMRETLTGLLMECGLAPQAFDGLGELSWEEFRRHFAREVEVAGKEQAFGGVDVRRAVAQCVAGGSAEDPLMSLAEMSEEEVEGWVQGKVARALVPMFVKKRGELVAQRERLREGEARQGNAKYGVVEGEARVAAFGAIEEFTKGIAGKIGLPHPRLWEGMEAEHCRREGHDTKFSPGNYNTLTTPSKEWLVATDEEEGRRVSKVFEEGERRVLPTEELMELEVVKSAGLRKEEVVALKLYTGPMYCLYNAALRGFPKKMMTVLGSNTYATTIHCIVSGIIKLSRVMKVPEDRTVYRGLGGMELPDEFIKTDQFGVRGGVEFAMMSTTLDRRVAVQYAGSSIPTVFEIGVGAVDRGASLAFLSQYPREEEILLPPRSYLEVVGSSRVDVEEDGRRIRVVRLKVNANMTSSTLEEIEGRRKELFISAGEHTLREIEAKLKLRLESKEVKEALVHRPGDVFNQVHHSLYKSIVAEVEGWLRKHQAHENSWYNDEWRYAAATRELMQLEGMAHDKFQRWIEYNGMLTASLTEVSRRVESDMMKRLEDMMNDGKAEAQRQENWSWGRLPSVVSWGPGSMCKGPGLQIGLEQAELALALCKRRGVVIQSLHEVNENGETPMVAAGAKGDMTDLKLLLAAGGWLESASVWNRETALHLACDMGHQEYVQALIRAGANLFATTDDGDTCLVICAARGHTMLTKYLCEAGGKQLVRMRGRDGESCAHAAVRKGHIDTLRVLCEFGGEELLLTKTSSGCTCAFAAASEGRLEALRMLIEIGGTEQLLIPNERGSSCAHAAALNGHTEAMRILLEVGGKELLSAVDIQQGKTCAHMAALGGHAEALHVLYENCGKELFMILDKEEISCAHLAALSGHPEALQMVYNAVGKELLMTVTNDGFTCAHFSAERGDVEVLRILHDSCGKELLMMANNIGMSCAHNAAANGHTEALRMLYELCGKDLLMMVNNQGLSCAMVAAVNGHCGALRVLIDAGGRELLMLADSTGHTCAHAAAGCEDTEALRVLYDTGGLDLLLMVDSNGVSCAHTAASNGRVEALRVLHEAGGTELLMMISVDGTSCAHEAALNGHSDTLRMLHEACGKELLLMIDHSGISCAHKAAVNGHTEALRMLYESCGKDLLMMVTDEEGMSSSCAHMAASNGHVAALRVLHEAGGTELLMMVTVDGTSCAHVAALNGHSDTLRMLHEACGKELLLMIDHSGVSCAHKAAVNGHTEALRMLYESCGKELLMMVNNQGQTCAHAAAVNGHCEALRMLIDAGGKELLMLVSGDAESCAHIAAMNGHVEALRVLHEAGGTELLMMVTVDGISCAHVAALNGHSDTLRMLHEACGKELLLMIDHSGISCAHKAALNGHTEALRMLYESCGKDLLMMVTNEKGMSCAIMAAVNGHCEALRMLIDAGGRELLMLADSTGHTCAHAAAGCEDTEALRVVYDTGGRDLLLMVDSNGISCAHLAASNGRVEALRVLHEAGGTELLMMVSVDGMSCAHLAALNGHSDTLRMLHEACGKELLLMIDHSGVSCAHKAAVNGHTEALRMLYESCGKELLTMVNNQGLSCAFLAAVNGHCEALRVLIDAGGRELLMLVSEVGESCAHMAASNGHVEALRVLHEAGGTELLMMVSLKGMSCAHVAALNGHSDTLRMLHEACGEELLLMIDHSGVSCAHKAAVNGHVGALRVLHEACGKELLTKELKGGVSCAHLAARNGHADALRFLIESVDRSLLMSLCENGTSLLMEGGFNRDVVVYLANEGGWDLVKIADAGGWTAVHRMLYCGNEELAREVASACGEEGASLLETAQKETSRVAEGGSLFVHRGWPSAVRIDPGQGATSVTFGDQFCTVRSRALCPRGRKAYYELEIVKTDRAPQFGFASSGFEAVKGPSDDGVGDDSVSWGVDGSRKVKWHSGDAEYGCEWQEGDVIGLACDLVGGKMHVSVNGDFSAPNGAVFDMDLGECEGVHAAFTGGTGHVRCNLGGGGGFKHSPPADEDGVAYTGFGDLE